MTIINLGCPPASNRLWIGYARENEARDIKFDFTALAEAFGDGELTILFQRPTELLPYPITPTVSGNVATWLPTDVDTAIAGEGQAQISYAVDDVVVKTIIFAVTVSNSLGTEVDPPQPYETWLEEMEATADRAEAAAAHADEVLASIPPDYSALADQVATLLATRMMLLE